MFIYVNKDDLRSIELYRILSEKGYYVSDDINDIKYADIVYLGIRGIDRKNRCICFDNTFIINNEVFNHLKDHCMIVTIVYNQYLYELSKEYKFRYLCLNKNNNFIEENSLLSAEGLISYIIRKRHYSLTHSKVIIFGNGHLGNSIIQILNNMKVSLTISARTNKHKDIPFIPLKDIDLSQYDIIINTIPVSVITHKMIETIDHNSILIDVSSYPYGLDHYYALSLNKNAYILSYIPSKYGYIEAALLIYNIIKDEYNEE